MTLQIYPLNVRGLTWPVLKAPEFSTEVNEATNFYQNRLVQAQNPRWHWTLTYEYLKDNPQDLVSSLAPHTDYRYLQGFFLKLQGKYAEFLFDDLYDDTIGMRPAPGGPILTPSAFKVSTYPTQQFYYPLGSYVVDNNAIPHLHQVIVEGVGGSTVPAFNTGGGDTISGEVTFEDRGVFSGADAGTLQLVTDTSGGITAVAPNAFGSGYVLGDRLFVLGGGGTGAILEVVHLSGSGANGLSIVEPGSGYATTAGLSLFTFSGSGSGATADITVDPIYYAPIQRNFGGQFFEDLTDLNLTVYPFTVWDNGVRLSLFTDYTIEGPGLAIPGEAFEGLYIKFNSTPSGPITVLGQFYFRVCMESDRQDIEQFMQQLWTIGGASSKNGSGMLQMMSSRVATQ
jgi:hypothetical protein